jgi:fucose permease
LAIICCNALNEIRMAQGHEIAAVYIAGVIQGFTLVTFPAASTVFTSPQHYGLSSTEYGGMFVPQAITAISASLLGAGLIQRLGIKRIYLLGLTANLVSMALLFSSLFVMSNRLVAYSMLLVATTSLGIGFGLTVPALNTFTAAFFPQRIDSAVLVLNGLLGLGTVLAPVFVAVFVGLGIWWGLPLLAAVLVLSLLLFSLSLPLRAGIEKTAQSQQGKTALPARFWIFAAFTLLYGICETLNGNWASLYMTQRLGASTTLASLGLTIFWGTVTAGRILFAAIGRWIPEYRIYQVLPLVVAVAFVLVSLVPPGEPAIGILAFGLAGLGCSALLPLTISSGQKELIAIAASVPGGLIAFYQMGYGIAAFGVGPLQQKAGLSLATLFGSAAIVALVMSALSFLVTRHRDLPAPNLQSQTKRNPNRPSTVKEKIL